MSYADKFHITTADNSALKVLEHDLPFLMFVT